MRRLLVFLGVVVALSVVWAVTVNGTDSDDPPAPGFELGATISTSDGSIPDGSAAGEGTGEHEGAGEGHDNGAEPAGGAERTEGPESVNPLVALAAEVQAEHREIEFTMVFTGDLLIHGGLINQARVYGADSDLEYDFRPMFSQVQSRLEAADLAVCVLETPLSPDNTDLSGYPIFSSPYQLADAVAAVGYDACSIASNHALDRGARGIIATLDNLDRVGVGHAGTARTAEEAATPTIYDVKGVAVAHLSWSYGTNGMPFPPDMPWALNVTDPAAVLDEARRAREAGAEFTVLHLQWGNEYQHEPTAEQRSLAEQFLSSPDIDLIAANHVHVVQPIEKVGDKWVVYGLGNFLSNQSGECCPPQTQDGVMVHVTVRGSRAEGFAVTEVSFTPTWVDRSDYTIIPVGEARHDPSWSADMRAVFDLSFQRTVGYIDAAELGVMPRE